MKDSNKKDDKSSNLKQKQSKNKIDDYELDRKLKAKNAKAYVKRKYKKAQKKEKLRLKAKNDKSLNKVIIRVSLFILAIILIMISIVALSHLNKIYKDTEEWKKSSPTKISSIPTDILYMNAHDRNKYLKYYDLYDNIWDSNKNDFKKDVNDKLMQDLKQAYNNINNPMSKVKSSYNNVNRLWQINQHYHKLVTDKKINKDVSPNDIKKFVTKNADYIVKDLIKPGDHKFSSKMHKNMLDLSNDVTKVDKLIASLDSNFTPDVKNKSIKVSGTALPGDKINYKDYINNMYYDWSYIQNQFKLIMNESEPILNNHDKHLAEYKQYISDKNDESNYKSFKSSFENAKKQLNSEIIDMPDFEDKYLSDAQNWANEHNVTLDITYEETDDETENKIINQTPNKSEYKRMLSSATLNITVAKKPKEEKEDKSSNDNSTDKSEDDSDNDTNDNQDNDSDDDSNDDSNNDSHSSNNNHTNDYSNNENNKDTDQTSDDKSYTDEVINNNNDDNDDDQNTND